MTARRGSDRRGDAGRSGADGAQEEGAVRLPMAGGRDAPEAVPEGAAPPPRTVEASSLRLVSTLAVAGALAGLVIVVVHQWTQPRIEAHQAAVLRAAVYEVLGGPERYETAFLVGDDFTTTPPPSADTAALERVYVGYDGGGRPVGVAVAGAKPGFQDVIRLIFGYDPRSGEVLGMKVLESKETPGLGDKIEKDSTFVAEFRGAATPLEGVKPGAGESDDNEIDMITGATISSRTIIEIINARLASVGGALGTFWSGSGGAAESAP